MLGAICGDFIGSSYEFNTIKSKEFDLFTQASRFTDDTVLTVATMEALLDGVDFAYSYRKWYALYPEAGYGPLFKRWASDDNAKPYNSWGNGSAMRVSPVGLFYNDIETVLKMAQRSAAVTHNHTEGLKGAQAVASCVYLAHKGESKKAIQDYITQNFGYNLDFKLDDIREKYAFDSSCRGSVPVALVSFLSSDSYEDAVRNAVSVGGDSDTIACIAGGIAEAYYKSIPENILSKVMDSIPEAFSVIIERFYHKAAVGGVICPNWRSKG